MELILNEGKDDLIYYLEDKYQTKFNLEIGDSKIFLVLRKITAKVGLAFFSDDFFAIFPVSYTFPTYFRLLDGDPAKCD